MMINMLTYSGISIFYIALQDIGDPIPVRKRESKLMSLTDDTRRDATAVELCESTDDSDGRPVRGDIAQSYVVTAFERGAWEGYLSKLS